MAPKSQSQNGRGQKRKLVLEIERWKRGAPAEFPKAEAKTPLSIPRTSSVYSDWDWLNDRKLNVDEMKSLKRGANVGDTSRANSKENFNGSASTDSAEHAVSTGIPEVWLTETLPKRTPYHPQIGDKVMFFQEGYYSYLKTLDEKNIYQVPLKEMNPWGKIKLKEPQLCKIIQIKFEIRPPRLWHLQLAVITEQEQDYLRPHTFNLKYHNIPDATDFLVLRQIYDLFVFRDWKPGDRFKTAVNDVWWAGKIIKRNRSAQSNFQCFKVRWDCDECDNLSPWDLVPLTSEREPRVGQLMKILPHELKNILYLPQADDWPESNQDIACERILCSLKELMCQPIAEEFLKPVDVNVHPTYAQVIEYPIDLTTIKARFKNRFYRRLASAEFDVRFIASNAEKYNERGSRIVRHAHVITNILFKIIRTTLPLDIQALCRELEDCFAEGGNLPSAGPSNGLRSHSFTSNQTWKHGTPCSSKVLPILSRRKNNKSKNMKDKNEEANLVTYSSSCNMTEFQPPILNKLDEESNPEKQFLLSVLPDFRQLNNDDKLDFRIHVLNFFKEKRNSTR